MKATKNILIGFILGAVIGWALGFLRLPYLEKNFSFLVGFISSLVVVALFFTLVFVRKKNSQLLLLLEKKSDDENLNKPIRTYTFIWILIGAFIISGAFFSSFIIHQQNELFETITKNQNKKIKEQSELIESSRRSNMVILLNEVLDKVEDDLKNNSSRTLSENTIARIVIAFNYTFIPYRYMEGENLSEKKLSPEKGQLLLGLYNLKIDSTSFNKIKRLSHFSGADLRKSDLQGVDLSGADLKDADLSDADLSGSNLNGADLRNANLWGAKANNSYFVKADMRRAILSWAEMNEAQLDSANFNGTVLNNAQFRKADLHGATFYVAKLDGALLNDANLVGVYFVDASLKKVNLTKANLTKGYVNRSNFTEAIMTETDLTQLFNVDKDWFEKLNMWHVTGAKEIQENYKIVAYTVIEDVSWYHLEKK
jgi:uncharacterized protein YjbI with pentapeptide repeats